MKLAVVNISDNKRKNIEVEDLIFAKDLNESLVHQVVTSYMAGSRSGSRTQKNRSAVSGGGKKPYSQKGTGRSRAGTSRNPIWRGGGVTFAAKPKDYSKKVNKKMYKGALSVIISELIRSKRLTIVKDFKIDKPKTKEVLTILEKLKIDDVLIVTEELDENLYLATRNLYHIGTCDITSVNPVVLIGYKNIIMTEAALTKIGEML